MAKKVFVSGFFDMLHSGHIEFLRQAAQFGDLMVAIGSDKTIFELKGHPPVNTEAERLFMVRSVSYVKDAFISSGSGIVDFASELRQVKPDLFIVNEDGNVPEKRELCASLGIEYKILQREPYPGLTPRSTSSLRSQLNMPYRIDMAGGWLDQPFVSRYYPGPVITISLEPTIEFNERSGMATSTRRKAIELWSPRLPAGDPEKLAKILFCYDNPPGTQEISGSQDAIGLVMPGLEQSQLRRGILAQPHRYGAGREDPSVHRTVLIPAPAGAAPAGVRRVERYAYRPRRGKSPGRCRRRLLGGHPGARPAALRPPFPRII